MAHAATSSTRGGAGVGTLPLDALYEVLLRLPAKDLCRLRAVCRPWRSLLSDPQFIAAHAARHPRPPLVVAGYAYASEGLVWDIVDLSGDVVRRVPSRTGSDERVTFVHLDFVCISETCSMRLFNMTTGVECALPEGLAEEYAGFSSVVALGQVASTGEYKVLRAIDIDNARQLCEILTFDGSDCARWRRKNAPPHPVSMSTWKRVAINSMVYFLDNVILSRRVASFDLDREEWRPSLPGPSYQQVFTDELSLAALNGSLVFVHRYFFSCLDLWFLMDFENGLWVKKHTIQAQVDSYIITMYPLLVLDDGRIVLVQNGIDSGYLKIYNPRTNISADVTALKICCAVGLYYGSPLSLSNRQTV